MWKEQMLDISLFTFITFEYDLVVMSLLYHYSAKVHNKNPWSRLTRSKRSIVSLEGENAAGSEWNLLCLPTIYAEGFLECV